MTRDERLIRLESWCQQLRSSLDLYAEQLAEQSLRIRFIMAAIELKMPNPSGLIIDGKQELITSDLYKQYLTGGRERMLMTLEQEMHEAQAALAAARENAHGNGQSPHVGEGQGGASGTGPGAQPAGRHTPDPDPTAAPSPRRRSN